MIVGRANTYRKIYFLNDKGAPGAIPPLALYPAQYEMVTPGLAHPGAIGRATLFAIREEEAALGRHPPPERFS
jgi:hypothetical protein